MIKGCVTDLKASTKSSEASFSGANSMLLGLSDVRSGVAELSAKVEKIDQTLREVAVRNDASTMSRDVREFKAKSKFKVKAEHTSSSSDEAPIAKTRKRGSDGVRRKSSTPTKKVPRPSSSESDGDRRRGRKERRIGLSSSDESRASTRKGSRKHRK